MLLETTIAIDNLNYEIDTTDNPEVIKSLAYDLGIIETIQHALKHCIVKAIEETLKYDIHMSSFEVDEDVFTLHTFDRELNTKELKAVAKLLGYKYYSTITSDICYMSWWTNNEMEV